MRIPDDIVNNFMHTALGDASPRLHASSRAINLRFIIFHDGCNNVAARGKENERVLGKEERRVISSTVYFTALVRTLQFHSY